MKIKYNIIGLLMLLGATACEDYLDINQDPNNPTTAPLSGLLSNTSFQTGINIQEAGEITSYYVQYLASPNAGSDTDTHGRVSFGTAWSGMYDIMTDLSDLEVQAEEVGATEYLGVAKILKAIHLGTIVDLWGNVPYSEAFFAQTLTPSYDETQALYTEIQTLLDEGIAALEQEETTFAVGGDDFIYGTYTSETDNNSLWTEKWLKAAHALKARYLLHLSETEQYDPQAVLAQVDQGFISNTDDAQVPFFDTQINPWASVAIANAGLILGGWISEQLIQTMDGTLYGVVDPRMTFMFGTNSEGEFVGTANGAGRGDAPEQGARSTLVEGTYYASRTAPILVITYAEQKFIEAEAALAAGDAERAYFAYLDGIVAHMQKIGVSETNIIAYIASPQVSVGAENLTRDLIMKEKYVAMFLHPEAWTDARRYDYQYAGMTLPANHNPELNGQFIRRLVYPESEIARNGANVPDVSLADNLWWDQ